MLEVKTTQCLLGGGGRERGQNLLENFIVLREGKRFCSNHKHCSLLRHC